MTSPWATCPCHPTIRNCSTSLGAPPTPSVSLSPFYEDPRPTNINHLTEKILIRIFQFLSTTELETLLQVSPKWNRIINCQIGFHAQIGTRTIYSTKGYGEDDNIKRIREVGVVTCEVGELLTPYSNPNVASFLYPETMRSLTLDGPINSKNLSTLLSPLSKLCELSIHYSALSTETLASEDPLSPSPLTSWFRSCPLNVLNIRTPPSCMNPFETQSRLDIFLLNVCFILRALASKTLSTLLLSLPRPEEPLELNVALATLSCLSRHWSTLRIFQIHWELIPILSSPDSKNGKSKMIYGRIGARIPISSGPFSFKPIGPEETQLIDPTGTSVNWDKFKTRNLTRVCVELLLNTGTGAGTLASTEIWEDLIRIQVDLKELFYMNRQGRWKNPGHLPFSHLRKLMLHVNFQDLSRGTENPKEGFKLDSSIFTPLHLTHLLIRGQIVGYSKPDLINLHQLPQTITVLSIRDMWVKSLELDSLLNLRSTLKKLRLHGIGTGETDTGLIPETTFHLIPTTTPTNSSGGQPINLQEFEFINCFNFMAFHDFEPDLLQSFLINHICGNHRLSGAWDPRLNFHCFKEGPMFDYGSPDLEFSMTANDVCNVIFR